MERADMQRHRGFTLVELLVVIAIIAMLAAILFPVFARAKEAAKKSTCLSNTRQIGMANAMYTSDYDGAFPQTKQSSSNPEIDDSAGSIEEPDYASPFVLLLPYTGTHATSEEDIPRQRLYACPSDPDPFGRACFAIDPDTSALTSYVVNAFLAFGLAESAVASPAKFVIFAERRSEGGGTLSPYCDYLYRPWFNEGNPVAPEDEMNGLTGAIATKRHSDQSNFTFADGHSRSFPWAATVRGDMHRPQ
jgi:prepilin-type N-terminal cleavage/methylation domain-containing protein/prepilin-type processing-associated H-X9-DG protein